MSRVIGKVTKEDRLRIRSGGESLLDESRTDLHRAWSETSFRMTQLRDNPRGAQEQFEIVTDPNNPGLNVKLSFDLNQDIAAPFIAKGARPKVAILREQGVNSHVEMAAAFHRAGFAPFDVHMTDLVAGRFDLNDFRGMVICGGFSYGDVLGAGEGWAKSILFNSRLRESFTKFFNRPETFSLGVCNGCQMMAALRELIPGTENWPKFVRNRSEQFEGRLSLVEVVKSPSLFFAGMEGSRMPIAVAHGEGYADFAGRGNIDALDRRESHVAALRRQPRQCDGALSVQSERLASRPHRHHDARRSRHAVDAASGARVSHVPELVAPGRLGRRQPVDANLPQRASLGGLITAPHCVSRPRNKARIYCELLVCYVEDSPWACSIKSAARSVERSDRVRRVRPLAVVWSRRCCRN